MDEIYVPPSSPRRCDECEWFGDDTQVGYGLLWDEHPGTCHYESVPQPVRQSGWCSHFQKTVTAREFGPPVGAEEAAANMQMAMRILNGQIDTKREL
jgi:hypothetical protein